MQQIQEQIINLTYRPFEERDKEGILRLWAEESGWGGLTVQQFNDWFIHTPYGKCIIIVAVDDENKIMGQIIYSPSRMLVDGVEIKTLRGSAPILDSLFRQSSLRSLDHPVFALIKTGFQIAREAGYQYVYSFPSYGWLGLLQLFPGFLPNPCETASYDCFALSLEEAPFFMAPEDDYKVNLAVGLTEEYDQLWREAAQQMPVACGIVRKAQWLNWAIGGHLKLEIRTSAENKLVGYMAIKKETGLITDVLARNKRNLEIVFQCAVNALHRQNPENIPVPFTKLKGMLTPLTQSVVESMGYTNDNYRFAFGGYLLDASIPFDKIQASQWYMMPLG